MDLIPLVANLRLKYDLDCLQGDTLQHLTEVSRYVYETANMNLSPGQPYVGSSAFAHKGGMHVHAVAKVTHSYEHVDPAQVGNERRILVSELSGQSTILTKTAKYQITHDKALMGRILTQVQELENAGYEFEAAEASFDLLVKKAMGQYRPWFEKLHYRVNIEVDRDGAPITEATVKVKVGDTVYHTAADGDGPVNALDGAISKALLPVFPTLHDMHLMDYKVRVVNAREGTAARVRVVIECRDKTDVWGTVGVSENIIEASWHALSDAIEYKLFKDQSG
jgi:2-isopropylmalate synthase